MISALVAEQPRQPEHGVGNESDDGEYDERHQDEGHGLAHNRAKRLPRHVGEDEQQEAVGRRQKPDHDVDDDHNTELHEVYAEQLRRGDEDRHDDEQDRRALEQATEDQEKDVHNQQE